MIVLARYTLVTGRVVVVDERTRVAICFAAYLLVLILVPRLLALVAFALVGQILVLATHTSIAGRFVNVDRKASGATTLATVLLTFVLVLPCFTTLARRLGIVDVRPRFTI